MARYRTIKPKFWDDEKLAEISREARLTFIGLWTFADDNGVIISENVWLKSKIYPHEDIKLKKFASWMHEMAQKVLIIPVVFNKKHYFYLPNFQKHQKIDKPNYEDVFIPTEILNKMLLNSANGRGLITDDSTVESSVEESSKGEYSGTPVAATKSQNKKVLNVEKLFRDSDVFDIEIFKKKFENTDYAAFNLGYYHEAVLNWSDGQGKQRKDWLAVARTFMLGDLKKGKAAMQNIDLLKKNTYEQGVNKNNNNGRYSDLEEELEGRIRGAENQ